MVVRWHEKGYYYDASLYLKKYIYPSIYQFSWMHNCLYLLLWCCCNGKKKFWKKLLSFFIPFNASHSTSRKNRQVNKKIMQSKQAKLQTRTIIDHHDVILLMPVVNYAHFFTAAARRKTVKSVLIWWKRAITYATHISFSFFLRNTFWNLKRYQNHQLWVDIIIIHLNSSLYIHSLSPSNFNWANIFK